ncbi:hypothetical protein CR513_24907, partial [Mucuna pruriens]
MREIEERMTIDRVQTVLTGANITPLGRREPTPTISFDDRDMRGRASGQDEPMVISVVAAEYKVERVLIDQGSSANILYWSTLERMQLPAGLVEKCTRIGRKVGSVWADTRVTQRCYEDSLKVERYVPSDEVNALDLDLDPRSQFEQEGPLPVEDLKRFSYDLNENK